MRYRAHDGECVDLEIDLTFMLKTFGELSMKVFFIFINENEEKKSL